jgi:DNA-binding transcriptional MerR regulator
MQLKVGELARSTGLTVRTLHHYDEIGLLKPSGRSESGYRLYSQGDVARLHGIQALRQMGLALAEIGELLQGRGAPPEAIVEQQMRAIEGEIARASELRERLGLIREQLAKGGEPGLDEWLQVLREMATYGKYFNARELKAIFGGYARVKDDWAGLFADVRAVMERALPIESPEVQNVARRWMALMLGWMDGDFSLMERWGRMYDREGPALAGKDSPPPDMLAFIQRAIDLRWRLLNQHFTPAELARLRFVPEREWVALDAQARGLIEAGRPPQGPEAQRLARQWLDLMDRMVSGDRELRDKIWRIGATDPVLRAGAPMSGPARAFLREALEKSLDPHVT